MEYLRPCPFCGSDAVLEDLGGAGTAGRYFVRCPKCKVAQDALWATKKTAVKRWNRRFPADGTGQHGKLEEFKGSSIKCYPRGFASCSECGFPLQGPWRFDYCPGCGAQMERSEG